jgi:hypothetical protein
MKNKGVQGLPLGRGRYLLSHSKIGKKTFNVIAPQIFWVGLATEEMNEPNYPLAVGLLGTVGVMMIRQYFTNLLHQLELWIRMKFWSVFHIIVYGIAICGKNKRKSNKWTLFSTFVLSI